MANLNLVCYSFRRYKLETDPLDVTICHTGIITNKVLYRFTLRYTLNK